MKNKGKIILVIIIIIFTFILYISEKNIDNILLEDFNNFLKVCPDKIDYVYIETTNKRFNMKSSDSLLITNICNLIKAGTHPGNKQKKVYDVSLDIYFVTSHNTYIIDLFKDHYNREVNLVYRIKGKKGWSINSYDNDNIIMEIEKALIENN